MRIPAKNQQSGFTLLELVVVVAVLGLIANLATELVALQTNQQRFETTKQRINTIQTAIIGESGFSDGHPYVIAGYLSDMGEIPAELRLLMSEDYCSDAQFFTEADCTTNAGTWENDECSNTLLTTELDCTTTNATWIDRPSWTASAQKGWRGPYIRNADQQQQGNVMVSVYPDAWASAIVDLRNFGWSYTWNDNSAIGDNSDDTWTIQSLGLDRATGTVSDADSEEFFYEQDFPATSNNLLVKTTDHNSNNYTAEISISSGEICSITTYDISGSTISATINNLSPPPQNYNVNFDHPGNHTLDIIYSKTSCGTDNVSQTEVVPVLANTNYTYPIALD